MKKNGNNPASVSNNAQVFYDFTKQKTTLCRNSRTFHMQLHAAPKVITRRTKVKC